MKYSSFPARAVAVLLLSIAACAIVSCATPTGSNGGSASDGGERAEMTACQLEAEYQDESGRHAIAEFMRAYDELSDGELVKYSHRIDDGVGKWSFLVESGKIEYWEEDGELSVSVTPNVGETLEDARPAVSAALSAAVPGIAAKAVDELGADGLREVSEGGESVEIRPESGDFRGSVVAVRER